MSDMDYMGDYLGGIGSEPATQNMSARDVRDMGSHQQHQQDMGGFFDFLKKKSTSTSHQSKPTLSKGSTGPAVSELQEHLDIHVDGLFGSDTEQAVKAFQLANGIPSTGVADTRTWAELLGEEYTDPAEKAAKQAQTAQTINDVTSALTGLIGQFTTPPANQQELLEAPVAPPAPATSFPWMWVAGGLAGVALIGGGIYLLTRD